MTQEPPSRVTEARYDESAMRAEACHGIVTRSIARMIRKNAMLTAEATTIAAQAFENRKKAASVMMNWPRTDREPPKYSATIAPISESVALTLSAVKMYGSAFGTRTFAKIAISPAAYERMSSSDAGSMSVRPRSVLIMIGKNTRTATTIIFYCGFRERSDLSMIGAKAMIGTEFAAIANGSSARLAVAQ